MHMNVFYCSLCVSSDLGGGAGLESFNYFESGQQFHLFCTKMCFMSKIYKLETVAAEKADLLHIV